MLQQRLPVGRINYIDGFNFVGDRAAVARDFDNVSTPDMPQEAEMRITMAGDDAVSDSTRLRRLAKPSGTAF